MYIECDLFFCYKDLIVHGNRSSLNENSVRYAPIEGKWDGGDEVLMFIPNLDRRKGT